MNKTVFGLCVALGMLTADGWESLAAEPAVQVTFPLGLGIVDPDAKDKLPPYILMFEGGVDADGRDVRRPLGRLEALRGASKMFPQTNQDPGLPVVLRGLRFHRKTAANGAVIGYEVELLGEYNAVRVPVAEADMKSFLSGKRTTFVLTGEKDYRIYAYVSSIKMEAELRGNELLIFKIEGDFSFREGLTSYVSKTITLTPPASREYLYRGERAVLPELPGI